MGDKQEQGWLSNFIGQTDKIVLAIGGYESSTGGIFPLGDFDDDESDTDEEENQEHEQGYRTVDMRMHLDDMGSFDDDEEDSLEGSPLTSIRGDGDTSGTPVSHRELTPREYDGNLDARSLDNNTPGLTQDFVAESVPRSSYFPPSGASYDGNHTPESKLETDEAPASNRPSPLASNDILERHLNSPNANTKKGKDPIKTPEGEQDQDQESPASPRSKNQSEPEIVPDAVVPVVQGNLDKMPGTKGIHSLSNSPQGNVAGRSTFPCQSPTTIAKTQGSVITSSSRDCTEGVPESKSATPDTDSQQEPPKRVAINVTESRRRKGGDGGISEAPGPSRYSHNGDSSWRKDEHDSLTTVRLTTLRPKERSRAEDANPASCVEDILKDGRHYTSSESQPDAGAGPPALGETSEKPAFRSDRETMKPPARNDFAEIVDRTPKKSPIFEAEDKAEPDGKKAISLPDGAEQVPHESGGVHRGTVDDFTTQADEDGSDPNAYISRLGATEKAPAMIGSKRDSHDVRGVTQGVQGYANDSQYGDSAPTKRERTYRRNRLGVMRHSSRLDDELQEQDRELSNVSLGNGEPMPLDMKTMGNNERNMGTIAWPDQALRPYDTPITDFSLPSAQAKVLSQLGFGSETLIVCSPFRRCLQTAGVVARTLGVGRVTVRLDVGERMDKVRKEIAEARLGVDVCWDSAITGRQRPLMFSYLDWEEMSRALGEGVRLDAVAGKQPPDDESGVEAKQRFIASISRLRGEYLPRRPVLVVAHGDTLDAAGESLASQIIYEAAYCAWAVFDLDDGHGGCVVESYGLQMIPL